MASAISVLPNTCESCSSSQAFECGRERFAPSWRTARRSRRFAPGSPAAQAGASRTAAGSTRAAAQPPTPSRRSPRSRRRSVLSAPHPTPARPDPVNTSSRRVDSGLDLVKSLVSDMCPACAIQVGQSPMSARRLAYNRSCLQ